MILFHNVLVDIWFSATGTENIEANSTARQENENAEVLTDTTEKPSRTAILLDPSTDSNAT